MRTAVSRLCRNQDDRAYILTEPLRRIPDGEGGRNRKRRLRCRIDRRGRSLRVDALPVLS